MSEARSALTLTGLQRKGAPVTTIFTIASVLEVGLVVVAAVMFLAMIVTALVVIIWSLAGVFSATRPPTAHH